MYISQHVSIGVAAWDGCETAEELCGRAATAMRDAKTRGGDSVSKAIPGQRKLTREGGHTALRTP